MGLVADGMLGNNCACCAGTFLRTALEKVGVEPNLVRIGKYKSAGAPNICLKKETPHSQSYNRIAEAFICSGIPHPLYASSQSSWGSYLPDVSFI